MLSKILPHIAWIAAIVLFTWFYHKYNGDKAVEENERIKREAAEKRRRRREWKKANGINEWENISEETFRKLGL